MLQLLRIALVHFVMAQSPAPAGPPSTKIPALLKAAFDQRQVFKTAKFNFREEGSQSGFATRVHNYTVAFAGDSLHLFDYGDDDGMIMYANLRTGEAPLGVRGMYSPQEWILENRESALWSRRLNSPLVTLSNLEYWGEYVDVRTVGLAPISIQRRDPSKMLELYRDLRFIEHPEKDGLTKITGIEENKSGKPIYEYEWLISKKQGSSVVSARLFDRDSDRKRDLVAEVTSTLVAIDGFWWPLRSEYVAPLVDGHTVLEFQAIEFNRSEHPATINADSMGIPAGASITAIAKQGAEEYYLGGGLTIDKESWKAIRSGYDLGAVQAFNAQAAAYGACDFPSWWSIDDGTQGLPGVGDRPDLWEAYVRRWVMRRTNHSAWRVAEPLTDVQRTTAKGILDECRKTASPIRMRLDKEAAKVVTELAEAEGMLAARNAKGGKSEGSEGRAAAAGTGNTPVRLAASGDSTKENQPAPDDALIKRIADLKTRKAELAKSPEIERTFDQLKSRLEGLLTAKQKDPANGSLMRGNAPPIPGMKGARPTPTPTPAPRPAPVAKP